MEKIIKLPNVTEPTIEQVLEEFLAEKLKKLKPKTAILITTLSRKSSLGNYGLKFMMRQARTQLGP